MCVDWVDRLVTTGWKIIRTVTKENRHFGPEENRQNCDSRKSTVMRDCVETLDSDCLELSRRFISPRLYRSDND
jgi:hypothetical protein